jgi:hypothetical protein
MTNMSNLRLWAALVLALAAALDVSAAAFSSYRETNQIAVTDKFLLSGTNRASGARQITATASNILESMKSFPNWPASGAGDVTTAQLNTASNTLNSALVANDTTTSNALRSAFIANDTTTSNGIVSLYGPQVAGLTNIALGKVDESSGVSTNQTLYGAGLIGPTVFDEIWHFTVDGSGFLIVSNLLDYKAFRIDDTADVEFFQVIRATNAVLITPTIDNANITATSARLNGATASRVAIFNGSKDLTNSAAVDTTELEYLDGVTSAIQTQLNAKAGTNANQTFNANRIEVGTLSVTNSATFGSSPTATIASAPTNNVTTTNLLGTIHQTAAATLTWDGTQGRRYAVTNRIGAATTVVVTNFVGANNIRGKILGEASGGSSRVVTFVFTTGTLVANLNDVSAALAAASYSETLTNGNAIEFDADFDQLNGTNVASVVTRQFKF